MTAQRLLELVEDPYVAGHLYVAVTRYRAEALRRDGVAPPRQLAEVAEILHAVNRGAATLRRQETTELPRLVTYDQAADMTNLSIRTLQRRVEDGTLPVVRIGRAVRFRPTDLGG